MSNTSVRPTSLEGIKRLAKSIKSSVGVKHQQALDMASHQGGFQNFRHARNSLAGTSSPVAVAHPTFLTAYWRHADGTSGRETLQIALNAPWGDLLKKSELRFVRSLGSFRSEGPDHLAVTHVLRSQIAARGAVCYAARVLQFVDATRLRPSSSHTRGYPKGRPYHFRVPAQDHVGVWFDENHRYLIADEPYDEAAEKAISDRQSWCSTHGYAQKKPAWPGMHNPHGGTRLYLLSSKAEGIPLEAVVDALDKLPAPPSELDWQGESAPRLPWFVSPGAIAVADAEAEAKEQAKQRAARKRGKSNSVGYHWTMVGPARRPNAAMPIDAHTEIGRLLKEILAVSFRRKGVYNRVDGIRSELDEWAQREYSPSQLSNDDFFALYYHDCPPPKDIRSPSDEERKRYLAGLAKVKKLLARHYPDCPPLRAMLKRVDFAMSSFQTWR